MMYVLIFNYSSVFFRHGNLEKEHERAMEKYEQETRVLKNKMEASLEFMKQEHNITQAKVRMPRVDCGV